MNTNETVMVSASELRKELDTIIDLAEWGIANEKLGGNVVKEEHWNGQRFAATQVIQWLEVRCAKPPSMTDSPATPADVV